MGYLFLVRKTLQNRIQRRRREEPCLSLPKLPKNQVQATKSFKHSSSGAMATDDLLTYIKGIGLYEGNRISIPSMKKVILTARN
ncbi:hypothetical protein NC651_015302 [Populus alba x Populus x berolinensis]|nr:hypothetical protein NC651_015302 [Populus alba x Populus x berolinensis]